MNVNRNSLPRGGDWGSPAANHRTAGICILAAVAVLAVPASAPASALFGVGDGPGFQSWQDAINDGRIQMGTDLTAEEDAFYSTQAANYAYTPNMELFAAGPVSDGFNSFDSLVMAWDAAPGTDLTIAAWEYVYDVDPDLTGTTVSLSVLAPTGIWDLSIELIDINGRVRGWFVDGTGLIPDTWQTITLDPTQPIQAGFIPGPIQDPLFDITQVVRIRLDEAGMTTTTFSSPPPGGTIVGMWNAWNHLAVIPEPSTAMLLVAGGLAGAFRRRRTG